MVSNQPVEGANTCGGGGGGGGNRSNKDVQATKMRMWKSSKVLDNGL